MLKASEVAWLKCRSKGPYAYCVGCSLHTADGTCAFQDGCIIEHSDFNDAAQFEALVAAELTRIPRHYPEGPCDYGNAGMCTIECALPWLDCRDARLKWARLKVEEELAAEEKQS